MLICSIMSGMKRRTKIGRVIEEGGVTPWPHERHAATALAKVGYVVKFIPANSTLRTADVYLNNTRFEMKAPCGQNISCVERNLKRAIEKCPNVIMDTCRIKNVSEDSVCNVLVSRLRRGHGLKRLILVKKSGEVIDISQFI